MKKLLTVLLAILMVFSIAACSKTGGDDEETTKKKVAVLLPFTGDQSYFDTLANGVKKVNAEYGNEIQVDLIEVDPQGSANQTLWANAYAEVCEDGAYDLVISGNATYEGFLAEACEKYPNQKFMNFDKSWAIDTPANCYVVSYGLDDLGYVVGALSAKLTKTGKVGVVVGMDIPAMNQFISGYCQVLADEGVPYAISFPGSFTDQLLGSKVTDSLIDAGCDVIWQVAGGLGTGVIESCSKNDNVWCIGVDQDQYVQFQDVNPDFAKTIITSALKNTDVVLESVCKMVIDGTIEEKMGKAEVWGIKENAVGIAENDYYKANVSEEIRNAVAETLKKVADGEVTVVDCLEYEDYNEWAKERDAHRLDVTFGE